MAFPNPALASTPRIAAASQILALPWIHALFPLGKAFGSHLYNTIADVGPFADLTKDSRKIYIHGI